MRKILGILLLCLLLALTFLPGGYAYWQEEIGVSGSYERYTPPPPPGPPPPASPFE